MPIVEYLEAGWAHVYWAVWGWTLWDGLVAPEWLVLGNALLVLVPMIGIAWVIQRRGHRNEMGGQE